jgi:hypothetical protein
MGQGSGTSALNWVELQVVDAAVVERVVPSIVPAETASVVTLYGRHFTMYLVSSQCRDAVGVSRVIVTDVINASVAVAVAKPGAAQTVPVVVSVEGRGGGGASAMLQFAAARSSKVALNVTAVSASGGTAVRANVSGLAGSAAFGDGESAVVDCVFNDVAVAASVLHFDGDLLVVDCSSPAMSASAFELSRPGPCVSVVMLSSLLLRRLLCYLR